METWRHSDNNLSYKQTWYSIQTHIGILFKHWIVAVYDSIQTTILSLELTQIVVRNRHKLSKLDYYMTHWYSLDLTKYNQYKKNKKSNKKQPKQQQETNKMPATNIDYANTYFEYPELSKIYGTPTYPLICIIKDEIKAHANSVASDLGGGQMDTMAS